MVPAAPSPPEEAAGWLSRFPSLLALAPELRAMLLRQSTVATMKAGERAYLEGAPARGYVLRLEGVTRVQKTSASGREVVLYRVGPGETCVLTTSCLLGGSPFPAEGVAESEVTEVVVPPALFRMLMLESEAFRRFVLENYGDLISSLILLLDEVMFGRLDLRLAALLIAEGSRDSVVARTHQDLAVELGSAREAVSRLLKEFERRRWIELGRGRIEIRDAAALGELASHRGS